MSYQLEVDEEKCIGCGDCVEVCPEDVYELQNGKAVQVNGDECFGCQGCVKVCEQGAITITGI